MNAYAKRRNASEAGDCVWRIEEDMLVEEAPRRPARRVYWTDILEIRMIPAPLRDRPWRHATQLSLRNGSRWEIDNAHYVGPGRYEDRAANYAPFVRQLAARLVEKAPYARAKQGATMTGYWAAVAVIALLLLMMAVLVLAIPTPGAPWALLLKILLLIFFVPVLWMWLSDMRPRGVRVADLPEKAFPSPLGGQREAEETASAAASVTLVVPEVEPASGS